MILRFQRALNKNHELRSKYPNDPSKCVMDALFSVLWVFDIGILQIH